jgi:hypothetical protein
VLAVGRGLVEWPLIGLFWGSGVRGVRVTRFTLKVFLGW